MTGRLVDTRPVPGVEPLVEIVDTLLCEVQLAGARAAALAAGLPTSISVGAVPEETYRRRRGGVLLLLTNLLEQEVGLRFAADIPFRASAPAFVEQSAPLSGYTLQRPDYPPSRWIGDILLRWRVTAAGKGADDTEEDRVDERVVEIDRLIRCALWHAMTQSDEDPTMAAVRYVVRLAETGQAHDLQGAAATTAQLLRAADRVASADGTGALFAGGSRPTSARKWLLEPMTWPDLRPAPLSPAARPALLWLIGHAQEMVDRVRSAEDHDSWLTALAASTCVSTCLWLGLPMAKDDVPLGLRTVVSQHEELIADYGALLFVLGIQGMRGAIEHSRNLAEVFRALGDDGTRFRRERALVPLALLDGTGTGISEPYRYPTWRTATAVLKGALPEQYRVADGRYTAMDARRAGEEVVSAINRITEAEGADRLRARHDLLSRYPWLGLAHRFEAELYHAEGDLDAAVAAMVAALVLTPEDPSFWQILAFLLKARDHERAALLANAIGGVVHRAGSGLHSL